MVMYAFQWGARLCIQTACHLLCLPICCIRYKVRMNDETQRKRPRRQPVEQESRDDPVWPTLGSVSTLAVDLAAIQQRPPPAFCTPFSLPPPVWLQIYFNWGFTCHLMLTFQVTALRKTQKKANKQMYSNRSPGVEVTLKFQRKGRELG